MTRIVKYIFSVRTLRSARGGGKVTKPKVTRMEELGVSKKEKSLRESGYEADSRLPDTGF